MKIRYDFSEQLGIRRDANENAIASRKLEHVRTKTYDILFPELKGRSLVTVSNEADEGDETARYEQYEATGRAELARDMGEDAPNADVKLAEFTYPFHGMKVKYQHSLQELRASMKSGAQLDQRKANAARGAVERKIDDVIWFGDSRVGLLGITNQPNTVPFTTPVGGGGSTSWDIKTSDEIVDDLLSFESGIITGSKEVESPNTLLFPLGVRKRVLQRMGDGDPTSIIDHFLAKSVSIARVVYSDKLDSNANWTGRRAVAYNDSPDKIEMNIPKEFAQLPPQARGYMILTFCEARIGGVELFYPKSMSYMDEI